MPDPELAEHAGRAALLRVKQFSSTSSLLKPERRVSAKALSWDDIRLGRLLDQGYFSSVYEATLSRDPHAYYAVKCLREDITEQQETFETAAVDLALEAQILARLMHPNIIHLHGSMGGCISESFHQGPGFFLVLDLLVDTLDKRLLRWRKNKSAATGFLHRSKQQEQHELLDRIEHVALGVAEGLAYVHSRGILYRDLKPQNIGFDEHGVVRIFDFGLAREANAQGQTRHMTGAAGTPRYMSPECAKNDESCSFPSDVYSFSVLFWEILTLARPLDHIKSLPQFHEEVVRRNVRPSLHKRIIASSQLRTLLHTSWDENPENRPTFREVCDTIKSHLSQSKRLFTDFSESSETQLRRESSGNTELIMRSSNPESVQEYSGRRFRFWRRERNTDDKTLPAVDRPKHIWFLPFLTLKKFPKESVLDLSGRSFRIRKYELERSSGLSENLSESARRLSGASQQSKCESDLSDTNDLRLSLPDNWNEYQRRRSSAGSNTSLPDNSNEYQRRRSSAGSNKSVSDNSNEYRISSSMSERMAETLAAEAKSNREVLRQLKQKVRENMV
jgi:serine/threonine protein kinase